MDVVPAGLRGKLALTLILFSTLPLLAILAGYYAEIRPRVQALSYSSLQANAVSLGARRQAITMTSALNDLW